MSDNTIIQQGSFTADGNPVTLQIRSDVDWMQVYNYTQIAAGANSGFQFYWQRGMALGTGIEYQGNAGGNAIYMLTLANPNGFSLQDSSGAMWGAAVATTASTNATQPVISTGSTAGLIANVSVVKLAGIAAQQDICGPEFLIDTIVVNTSFRIANALATAPGAVGGAGNYRILNYNPLFYPRRRYIVNISQAANASIRTSMPHGYTTGQLVRFSIPAVSGMVELDGLSGVVTVTNANNFTVDIDSSAFTAFTYPTAAQVPCSFPLVVPFGEDSAAAPNVLDDATENQGYLGMLLAAGADSPAGQNNDVIYWVAGKSFSVS